jgi:nucleoside-diphosphate-sugar epimerase
MSKLLLTGATGFIGSALLGRLVADGDFKPLATVRVIDQDTFIDVEKIAVGDISPTTDWSLALTDVEFVVHAAARAHKPKETSQSAISMYREANTESTLNLARQAAEAGVKRFVFISSIGVMGNRSNKPISENDNPNPAMPYAVSKLEAELGLCEIMAQSEMEVVIIRPPLVYGPQAPGNFGRLVRLVKKGVPFPLALVQNLRSFVAVDNLVDLIITCLNHPAAANQVFHAGDGMDLSTPALLNLMGDKLGKPARLVPFPVWILKLATMLAGKQIEFQSLCGSLQVDISKAQDLLEWKPPVSVPDAMHRAVQKLDN